MARLLRSLCALLPALAPLLAALPSCAGLMLVLHAEPAGAQKLLAFTSAETGRILAHGPWPPATTPDRGNRASGNTQAIALGERLFFSPRLSGSGGVLCASCHEPWRGYADGRSRGLGIEPLDRNTQSVVNLRFNRWFGWDGANDNLWAQSIRPLLERREMRSSAAHVAALVRGDAELSRLYRQAFGAQPPADDEALLVDTGKALAAYLETLVSARTPFDEFRDALGRGDAVAAAGYSGRAQRGLRIFIGKGGCADCHAGANFSDGAFHRSGVSSVREDGAADTGREGGIRALLASRYNLLGQFNDDAARATATGTRQASAERDVTGAFRTPGLRNAALTAPYMHDGSMASLCEVLLRHPARDAAAAPALTPEERSDLLLFLGTLTEADSGRAPGGDATGCR